MSRRAYHRKTGYIPQDERRLDLRVEHRSPVDMSQLADVILIHAICLGQSDTAEPVLSGRFKRYPFNQAPRQAP